MMRIFPGGAREILTIALHFFDISCQTAGMKPEIGYVSSTYVQLLFDYIEQQGMKAATVLGRVRPDTADGLGRTAMSEWRSLLERAAQALQDPLLGLHVGQTISPAHIGVLGYVILASANLGEALLRLQHFYRLVYDAEPMQIRQDGEDITLHWGVDHGRPGQQVDACALAALVQFARDITGHTANPSAVIFVNPEPDDAAAYRDYFACPVLFEQPGTQVRFPMKYLATALRQPDAALLGILEQQATALLNRLPDADDFEQQIRRAIARLARSGTPGIEQVAAELNTSVRTLQRRLAERHLQFQLLLDDTRYRLAQDYLADRRLQLSEVAQLLGYSEQSAFNRAFRRWSGSTPRVWRQAL